MQKILSIWHDFAAWALLALIVFAPWALGCIPTWAENALVFSSLAVSIAYLFIRLLQRSLLFPHWIALLAMLWIIVQGWWMVFNAQFILDPRTHILIPITQPFPNLRGSLDFSASMRMMWRVSALLGVFWMVVLLNRDSLWRKRIVHTIGFTAFTLLLFGIYQKISGSEGIWPQYGKNVWPFATYFYHGNAGTFINLTFPIVATLAWRAAFIDSIPVTRSLWISAFVVCVAVAFINSSKAALVIFALLFVAILFTATWFSRKIRIDWRSLTSLFIGLAIIIGAVGVVTISGDTTQTAQRWNHALNSKSAIASSRIDVSDVLLKFSPAAGYWGFGPNTFRSVFPYMSKIVPAPRGYWEYAHEDYLQTLVEWGYLGSAAWATLLLGGLLLALWMIFVKRSLLRKRDLFLLCCLFLSIGSCVLHSLVDFPMQIPSLSFYLVILLGMAWSSPHWEKPSRIKNAE